MIMSCVFTLIKSVPAALQSVTFLCSVISLGGFPWRILAVVCGMPRENPTLLPWFQRAKNLVICPISDTKG